MNDTALLDICGFLSPRRKKKYKKGKEKKYTTHELLDYVRFSETKENKNGLIHPYAREKEKKKNVAYGERERDDRVHIEKAHAIVFPGV